ncbi:MAG TPA: thioredoxin domain-containing protein [Anaerolineae bacterium]
MEDSYIKSGKVKFTYKFYPVVDQGRIGESNWAAQAAECANLQGKFWDYHDKLFSVWTGENVGTFTKAKLKQYAADLQLNATDFNQCLDGDKTASVVQADMAEANRQGVQGTPTYFLNGRLMQLRTLQFDEFSRTFDSLLK